MYLPTLSPTERERYDYVQGNLNAGVHGYSFDEIHEGIGYSRAVNDAGKYYSSDELEDALDDFTDLEIKHDKLTQCLEEITVLFEKHTGKVTKEMFSDITREFRKLVELDFSRDICVSEIEHILSI